MGAFIKVVQGIIRVVTWFATNAAHLTSLMNPIFSSISAIAAGNIGGVANFIEQSLATAVISFLADLLGFGSISKKVQGIIEQVQAPIKKAIDWVVQKAVAMGKKLWAMITVRSYLRPSVENVALCPWGSDDSLPQGACFPPPVLACPRRPPWAQGDPTDAV
ncbi:hypothetical protein F8S13_14570 [Chloroflexia bacterium SDU3-3]|nr:hypothetical protein F8S13_14570 [Chloroflexia bacterium SDU3-3]